MPPKTSDKLEKEVRAIAKLPGNKQCVDCGEKLPQYADLTHFTFVCTRCSGIHREFSWKIKGISMSVFTEDEAKALKRGGNEKCNARFLARYRTQNYHPPNPNDVAGLREFIRMKYVDRKWYADGREERAPSVDSESKEVASTVSRPSLGSLPEEKPLSSVLPNVQAVDVRAKQPPSAAQDLLDLMSEPVPVVQPAHHNGWDAAPSQQMNAFGQPAQPAAGAGVFGAAGFGAAPQSNAFGAFGGGAPAAGGFDAFNQPQSSPWQTQPAGNGFHQPGTNAFAAPPANVFGQPQPQAQPHGQPFGMQGNGFGAPQVDHFGGAPAGGMGFGGMGHQQPPQHPQHPAAGAAAGMFGAPAPVAAPAPAVPEQHGDKFSAFDDIPAAVASVGAQAGSNPFDAPSAGGSGGNPFGGPPQASQVPNLPPGTQVMYADASLGQYFPAQVVQVHHETHPPFVTIRFPTGQERQTELGRIVLPQSMPHHMQQQHVPQQVHQAPQQQAPQQPDPFGALAGAAWDSARAGAGASAGAGGMAGSSRAASVADPFGDVGGSSNMGFGGGSMGYGAPEPSSAGKSQNPFDMF